MDDEFNQPDTNLNEDLEETEEELDELELDDD